MAVLTYREAIREALREEMNNDPSVFLMGEDIGVYGGSFKVTQGLYEEFGPERVMDTPLSESVLVGAGVGAAIMGNRPVVEIMYGDFLTICADHLVNSAAKMRYIHGTDFAVPMVVRTPQGAGIQAGAYHSQSLESWFIHSPGLKVVMPSTPADAKGLLKASIRDNNPVLFLEHKLLYALKGEVPKGEFTIPIGKADIKKEGRDITVVATSLMVHRTLTAAQKLLSQNIDIEIIDPRTLMPLDKETILSSVRKTRRLLIVHEACKTGGFGSEVAAIVSKEALEYLDAPIERVGGPDIPVPFSPTLEFIPTEEMIIQCAKNMLGR